VYKTSSLLTKRDKLGIHTHLLATLLHTLEQSIDAGLVTKKEKISYIQTVRRNIEVAKHLLRIEYDLHIISSAFYLKTIQELEVISMMANGWIKSIAEHPQ